MKWTREKIWGSVGATYRAASGGWKYVVDQPVKGHWELRGWGPDGAFLYRHGFRTAAGAKAASVEHAGGVK